MIDPPYIPPKIWTWNKENGGRFANINRPIAGATHEKDLPVGLHPLQLYSLATPNGVKVTVLLEELLALGHAGAEYDAWLIRINEGEQFGSGFVAVNPNSKIPALMDRSGPTPIRIFESGAILLYLAEKFGAFVPAGGSARAECLSVAVLAGWKCSLLGRRLRSFLRLCPRARSNMRLIDSQWKPSASSTSLTATRRESFSGGDTYSIADMAVWPWYGALAKGQVYEAGEFFAGSDLCKPSTLDRRNRRTPGRAARPHGESRNGRAVGSIA